MNTLKKPLIVAALVAGLALTGCDRTVSKSESKTVNTDGSTRSKETSVTQKSDGTVVKKEESKSTPPSR